MDFTAEDKAAIKFLQVNQHYGDKRLWKEFPTKNWSLRGLNKLLKNRRDTERLKGAGRLRPVRCIDRIKLE